VLLFTANISSAMDSSHGNEMNAVVGRIANRTRRKQYAEKRRLRLI
jgi:hypothetical protein